MIINQHSISRDKDEEILREKIASSLFIRVDNLNLNIIKDNEVTNRVVSPPPSLVLANRITIIFNQ